VPYPPTEQNVTERGIIDTPISDLGIRDYPYYGFPTLRNWTASAITYQTGVIICYTIEMAPTSNAFLPGHRIRLDITSSDFPNYDRNHNTAADQNANDN